MTLDITKQVQYWNNGAAEDWSVAQDLLQMRHVRQALFFAHLTLEKMLKAYLTKKTETMPPRTHNLPLMAQEAALDSLQEYQPHYGEVLLIMNTFNMEGRYPHSLIPAPSMDEAQRYLSDTQEVYEWLQTLL